MKSSNTTNGNKVGAYYQIIIKLSDNLLFNSQQDYRDFLSILRECSLGSDSIEVLAYSLCPNIFRLLIFDPTSGNLFKFMNQFLGSYNKYYYNKYRVNGIISETDYNKNTINEDEIVRVSCEIHTCPSGWMNYEYSSIRSYFYNDDPIWITKRHLSEKYGSTIGYLKLLQSCK